MQSQGKVTAQRRPSLRTVVLVWRVPLGWVITRKSSRLCRLRYEGQASAVMRFGEFKQLVDRAGFTWRLPYPIESHEIVNTQQLRTVEVGYRNAVRNKTLR